MVFPVMKLYFSVEIDKSSSREGIVPVYERRRNCFLGVIMLECQSKNKKFLEEHKQLKKFFF